MGLYTGFLEGLIQFQDGTPKILPFQDKIAEVQFQFTSENLVSETFSAQGIKGASESCPIREECMFMMQSQSIAWSFMQAASGYLDKAPTLPVRKSVSAVLSTVTGTPTRSTFTLPETPTVGAPVIASDLEGIQYPVTVSGTTVTFDADHTGKKVTIQYSATAPVGSREIALGSGSRIGEVGVYGQFFGCPDTLLITASRGIIEANLDFSIGDDAATAAMTIRCLRDANGNFARIIKLPSV